MNFAPYGGFQVYFSPNSLVYTSYAPPVLVPPVDAPDTMPVRAPDSNPRDLDYLFGTTLAPGREEKGKRQHMFRPNHKDDASADVKGKAKVQNLLLRRRRRRNGADFFSSRKKKSQSSPPCAYRISSTCLVVSLSVWKRRSFISYTTIRCELWHQIQVEQRRESWEKNPGKDQPDDYAEALQGE